MLFDPLHPEADKVRLPDIAHALSQMCRFAAHTSEFYSVAQHSVLVSRAVPPEFALLGLLHDAGEAYLTDVPTPWKKKLRLVVDNELLTFHQVEDRLLDVVLAALGVDQPGDGWAAVRLADLTLLATEARDLKPHSDIPFPRGTSHPPIEPWGPHRAKAEFMARYFELARPSPRQQTG